MPRLAAAFLLGALCVAGFAPFHFFLLTILSVAGLIRLWSGEAKDSAWIGFSFGMGLFLCGVSWIYVSLHDFGGMPLSVAAVATVLFCAFLALYPALVGFFQARLPGSPATKAVLLIPALLALEDWLRGWLFTGFPWLALGYSQTDSPLAGYAPILGAYGLSLITAVAGGLLFLASKTAYRKKAAILFAIVFLCGYGLQKIDWTHPEGPPVTVSLLQGNIPQDRKWSNDELESTMDIYLKLALSSKSRLIILPETAIPIFYDEVPREYLNMLEAHARENHGDVLIGLPERLTENEYYNGVFNFGLSPHERYRKSHLVPFGEFLPVKPVFGWLLDFMHIPMSDFSRGSLDQQPMHAAGERLAIDICYEDVFGEEIILQLPQATMLINVTDDAWFGDSIAPRQHLQISRMRALETGRMMLRATNTGMTAVVDAHGRLVSELPTFMQGSLDASVQGYSGATPYVSWGNHAFLLLAGAMLLLGLAKSRKNK
ncbi:MAG: apolipoprotein N-acyltransferase [Burkholderiales bacterium]|nr:apolipoprotein N-acyltransferase [Burkholderiales bacterium]